MSKKELKIYCTSCEAKINVSDQKSFSHVHCPACNEVLLVPKQFGDILLIEKLEENDIEEHYRGLKDLKDVSVIIFKSEYRDKFNSSSLSKNSKFYSYDKQISLCRPWPLQHLIAFQKIENKAELNAALYRLSKLCNSLKKFSDEGFYFNTIKPNKIYKDNDSLDLLDSVALQLLSDCSNASLETSIREAGKIFNYFLFDHTEDYKNWLEKYLRKNCKNNYYQFPWVFKGEKSDELRKLVRKMILQPEGFKSFDEIQKELTQLHRTKESNYPKTSAKQNKNDQITKIAEKNANKISRSVKRTKRSKNSSSLVISAIIIVMLFIAFLFIKLPETDTQKIDVSNKTQKASPILKQSKTSRQLTNLEDKERQREIHELSKVREEKAAKAQERKKQNEIEKQAELKKFLAVISPSDEVKAKYRALPDVSSDHLQSLMNKHCNDCHNSRKRKGDFVLDIFKSDSSIFNDYEIIKHAYESVKLGEMPPEDEEISPEERRSLIDYFEKIIYTLESKQIQFKSSALVRRLTPYEYDYTVKDISGLDLKLGESFPGDGGGNQGFANDASLMGVSPIQLEKFLTAAEEISAYSFFDIEKGFQFLKSKSTLSSSKDYLKTLEDKLYKNYRIYPTRFKIERYLPKLFKASADYIFSKRQNKDLQIIAAKHKVSPHFLKRSIAYFTSSLSRSIHEVNALKKWKKLQLLRFDKTDQNNKEVSDAVSHFINSYIKSKNELSKKANRERINHARFVKNIESVFHFNEEDASKFLSGKQLLNYNRTLDILEFFRFSTNSRDKKIYTHFEPLVYQFLSKVYRRPPDNNELYTKTNDLIKDSLRFGLPVASRIFVIRAMSSFNFTFRIEKKNSKKIDDYDLASRLSYFLWAGPPDEELLSLAASGKLNNEKTLTQQIKRMLKDAKSARLAKHFASQWLRFGDILHHEGPNKKEYRGFDKNLAKDMWQESAMSFNYIVKNDRSVLEIFNADYTFINNKLSKLYRLNQNSPGFKKVTISNGQRGGILGHAGILTMTSFGQRTSPIIRGNWILSVLLGTPTPPPPMNVDPLPEEDVLSDNFTLKEQLAKHRDNPACRGCHKKIDPLGIVLENYDVVGRWRTKYSKVKVDASSQINDIKLNGPEDLKKYLMDNKIQYMRNLSKKLLSYALGRSIFYYDNYLINKMIENSIRNDYEFSSLVKTIVLSPQFQLK